ncbi:MAG: macro domain-containing protein [Ruminococcus sp.]|nr:macro domain-containing protein [Ruminococcus sp.]MCM1380731.1 macro domain-containing protein [Muribaculaceae bacterium]MCM1479149.1 macro domain-containing protein [Muribaculaceae bacterium]
MPFTIVRQDITKMQTDAIVNAANNQLRMGGGVCGAIFKAAGYIKLQEECYKVSPVKTGGAAITPGFALPAKYVIHAVGPVYQQSNVEECEKLIRSAYTNSLKLAAENGCVSIAFPLISSGIYGYPKDEALRVAISAIKDFLAENDMDVYLVIFDRASFAVSEKLLGDVESYIDENYVDEHFISRREMSVVYCEEVQNFDLKPSLEDFIEELDEPFNTTLLKLIDAKGKTDTEVYKRANIDRKLFSKIRTGKGYMPSKRTILALAVALELTLNETDDLLERAGYALSHSQKFDVIVEFFIVNGKYDIFEINEVLFKYDQPLLGAGS